MGRTQPSNGRPPAAIQKAARAKDAKQTANKTVPALLASTSRAKKGVEDAQLINDGVVLRTATASASGTSLGGTGTGTGNSNSNSAGLKISLLVGDVLDAAEYLRRRVQSINGDKEMRESEQAQRRRRKESKGKSKSGTRTSKTKETATEKKLLAGQSTDATLGIIENDSSTTMKIKAKIKTPNIGLLNPASPLRPGGGFLTGSSSSDEDVLCACTTLYASLREEFYRLPDLGGIWTPDTLVFRRKNSSTSSAGGARHGHCHKQPVQNGKEASDRFAELPKTEMWYVDVLSAGMLRFPDVQPDPDSEGALRYTSFDDRDAVERKMRAALAVFGAKGCERLVLPAWGVGTYGNPAGEVAGLWRKTLLGEDSKLGDGSEWGFREVVFSVRDGKVAGEFKRVFGELLQVECIEMSRNGWEEYDEENEWAEVVELRTRIAEMRTFLQQTRNPDLYDRMAEIVAGLERSLASIPVVSGSNSAEADDEHIARLNETWDEDSDGDNENDNIDT